MSEDYNIPIDVKFATTGEAEAADGMKKVETAADALGKSTSGTTGFGGMLDKLPEQAQAAAAPLKNLDDVVKKLVDDMGEVSKETTAAGEAMEKTGAKSGELEKNVEKIARTQKAQVITQLGGQVSGLGGAFKSVADQMESFDAATAKTLRTAGENLEAVGGAVGSIAVGFALGGPLGAGVAAVGEGIKYMAGEMGKAAEEAVAFEAKAAGAFDQLVDKLGDVASAKAAVELKTWLATLDDEEAAITRQNEALERNRELLDAKAAAQAKLDAAKTKNEIAAIDADPNLSDAEKIRKKAAVVEAAEKKKVEDQINAQGRDVVEADQDAEAKDAEAKRIAADAAAIKQRKDAEDAERKDLERRQKIKDRAEAAIPAAAAQAAADTKTAEMQRRNPIGAEARQDKAEASQQALEDLKNKAYSNPKEAIRLEALNANKANLEAEAAKSAAAAVKAAAEADKAKRDAEGKRRIFEETLPTQVQTYQEEARGRTSAAAGAAAAAEKRDKEKADAEAARERRDGMKNDLEGKESALDATSRSRGLNMRNFGQKNDNKTASDVGKALSDGTDAAEIQKLGDQVKEAASKNGEAMTSALMKVLEGLNSQAAEIEKLKGQVRKGRDMK